MNDCGDIVLFGEAERFFEEAGIRAFGINCAGCKPLIGIGIAQEVQRKENRIDDRQSVIPPYGCDGIFAENLLSTIIHGLFSILIYKAT